MTRIQGSRSKNKANAIPLLLCSESRGIETLGEKLVFKLVYILHCTHGLAGLDIALKHDQLTFNPYDRSCYHMPLCFIVLQAD